MASIIAVEKQAVFCASKGWIRRRVERGYSRVWRDESECLLFNHKNIKHQLVFLGKRVGRKRRRKKSVVNVRCKRRAYLHKDLLVLCHCVELLA